MAATASLLKSSCCSFFFVHRDSRPPVTTLLPLKWRRRRRNPVLFLQTSTQIPPLPSIKKTITTTTTGFITVQSSVMNNNHPKNCFMEEEEEEDDEEEERKRNQNPFKRLAEVMLGVLLFVYDPNAAAIAASGGRMGGRAFSSSSSSSSRSSSSTSSRSSSSSSSSSPSRSSYSSSSSSSSSRSSSPSISIYSSSTSSPSPSYDHHYSNVPGPSLSSVFWVFTFVAAFVCVAAFFTDTSPDGSDQTSVLKLQVGLLGMARSFQRDLNRIAETADTSTPQGLSYILQETVLALLRHPDCCISGYSYVDVKRSIEDGEKLFDKLSIEERGKFDEETLVNVNNIKRKSTTSKSPNGFSNEYIVITILVAAEGAYKLPAINGTTDLKEALQTLGSISSRKTMAVEVLWTPQKENDTLTEQELREDYPLLRPL